MSSSAHHKESAEDDEDQALSKNHKEMQLYFMRFHTTKKYKAMRQQGLTNISPADIANSSVLLLPLTQKNGSHYS